MRLTAFATSLAVLVKFAAAFTNGTLLPAYLCGDAGDGYPKSAGTLIPYLQLGTAADNYNQFPPGNATFPIIAFGDNVVPNVTAIAPTARQIIGAFHNGGAQLDAIGNIVSPVNYEKATTNPIWLAPQVSNALTGQGSYVITPGALHTFVVAAHCPAPDPRGFNNANVAIDGLFLYAIDTATGDRIGSWVNVGPTLTNWAACNPKQTSSASVGIVHNQLASGSSNIGNLTWQAPATIVGNVQFKGAGVSDCGFGPVSITYNTTTSTTAPSVTAQGLTANTDTANVAPYVNKTLGSPDLPQNIPLAVSTASPTTAPTVAPTAAAAVTFQSFFGTKLVTGGIAIAIAAGGAFVGALIAGSITLVIVRKQQSKKEPMVWL
jgi:hypothetical protein